MKRGAAKRKATRERRLPKQAVRSSASLDLLRQAHSFALTPLVLKQASKLSGFNRMHFDLWKRCRTVEFLPEGIPYKVIDGIDLLLPGGATVVMRVNKPLILVAKQFSLPARREAARHEYTEWRRLHTAIPEGANGPAHKYATKTQNPRLRRQAIQRFDEYKERILQKELLKSEGIKPKK